MRDVSAFESRETRDVMMRSCISASVGDRGSLRGGGYSGDTLSLNNTCMHRKTYECVDYFMTAILSASLIGNARAKGAGGIPP